MNEKSSNWTFLAQNHPLKKNCATLQKAYRRRECFETDWTPAKLELKLGQIQRALSYGRQQAPDFLALIEVESEDVVKRLGKLIGLNQFAVSKAADERGLRVALLWREQRDLRILAVQEHVFSSQTRPILEVRTEVRGKPITFLVNHWPALSRSNHLRDKAMQTLLQVAAKKTGELIALGDFNLRECSVPDPLASSFFDLTQGEGTYYYAPEGTWHPFDRILISPGLKKMIREFRIERSNEISLISRQGKRERIPWRYDFSATRAAEAGFSDHYPVSVKITF